MAATTMASNLSSVREQGETNQLLANRRKNAKSQYNSYVANEGAAMSIKPEQAKEAPVARFQESLWDDLRHLREGSIPQSVVVALCNALACGIGAYLYYVVLQFSLEFLWRTVPQKFVVDVWPEWTYGLYIPLAGFAMCIGLGVTVTCLGEPGDLAYTIDCVHKKAFVHLNHVGPMCVSSLFSIVGGGSVGPEAPLVAICAAIAGNISFYVFKQTNKNIMRKHTLMGMSAALAAFFGAPLGGSLFALEVCSKFGIEYFEHTVECILCGLLAAVVFRFCTGVPPGQVWSFPTEPLKEADLELIIIGGAIGLLGAFLALLFVEFHWKVISLFRYLGLLDDSKQALTRALLGGVVIYSIGAFVPQTLFWGEAEFQTLWNQLPASTLEHVFPTTGLIGFEMDSCTKCLLVGFAKLVTISFSVAGGYRGGFIFPFFAAGSAFGRAFLYVFPSLPPTVTCLSFAAGINVAVTKTSMSTTLILIYLSGEQNALSPILAASIVSLLASSYTPFIKTQVSREDEEYEMVRQQQQDAKRDKDRFSGIVNSITHARRLFNGLEDVENVEEEHVPRRNSLLFNRLESMKDIMDDVEEDDVPLSETRKSFQIISQRGYLV